MHVEFFRGLGATPTFDIDHVSSFFIPKGVQVENGDIINKGGEDWLVYNDLPSWEPPRQFFTNELVRMINLDCINAFATDVVLDHPRIQRTGYGPGGMHMYAAQ